MSKIARALSIAGSDSGGGAGIQADLKTFAALGVHGMTAITSITAQNTLDVIAVQDVEPEIVRAQIRAVADDIGVDAVKTGMLHMSNTIEVVADELQRYRFPVVVDPVMIAKSGAHLLLPEAVDSLVKRMLPISTVVTPNAMEAEVLSGVKVETIEDGKRAGEKILRLGPSSVVVKGGHIMQKEGKAIDILCEGDEYLLLEAPRYETKNTHGTGCSFSSAIAAELAKGRSVRESVQTAKAFVNEAIKSGLPIGRGYGPLNPMASLYREATRYQVLSNVRQAIALLEQTPEVALLVPEVQMNIGMALPYAREYSDIAAVDGRIIRTRSGVKASGCPEFGVSRHVARTIMAVMRFDPERRAGINIRYSDEAVKACEALGLVVSYYDRREEPEEVKRHEGMTTYWGAEQAVKRAGRVPDVIYHLGDWGKEAMITVVGRSALEIAGHTIEISKRLSANP